MGAWPKKIETGFIISPRSSADCGAPKEKRLHVWRAEGKTDPKAWRDATVISFSWHGSSHRPPPCLPASMGSCTEASLACFMDSPPQHLAGMNISAGMAAGGSAVERNRGHAAHAAKVLVRPLRAQHVAANRTWGPGKMSRAAARAHGARQRYWTAVLCSQGKGAGMHCQRRACTEQKTRSLYGTCL